MQASTVPDCGPAESSTAHKAYGGVHPREQNPLGELSNLNDSAIARSIKTPTEYERFMRPQSHDERPRLTIKQLRQAAQEAAQNNPPSIKGKQKIQDRTDISASALSKKKQSLFGGLFQVKEPTQIALNQVAAQMVAQHGSTSPTKVPNVRLERMPDHVPRVNTKWDGVPDSLRQRDKKEKERAKALRKDASLFGGSRSRSSEAGEHSRKNFNSRNSSSTNASFDSRGRSSGSNSNTGGHRFYAQSANSSGDLASQQRTDHLRPRASSLHSHSASAASLPGSFVESIPEIPQYLRDAITMSAPSIGPTSSLHKSPAQLHVLDATNGVTADDQPPAFNKQQPPGIEEVPQHSRSPLPSPQELAPLTPSLHSDTDYMFGTKSPLRGAPTPTAQPLHLDTVAGPPARKQKPPSIITPAFLAGEAQELVLPDDQDDFTSADLPLRNWESRGRPVETPLTISSRVQQDLEKRPDSSRARLGLRASMLLREDETPWGLVEDHEAEALSSPKSPTWTPKTPTSPRPGASPRTKFSKGFGLFNKDKDKS